MIAPEPRLRSSELAPCGGNMDKTENHPLVRKGDRLRMPDTDIDVFYPELLLVGEGSACSGLVERKCANSKSPLIATANRRTTRSRCRLYLRMTDRNLNH
jgi:hypothetical protein